MKNLSQVLLGLCLLSSITVLGQKHLTPPEEDILMAKQLKEIFPDDHVALLENTDVINFNIDRRTGNVTVNREKQSSLINMDNRADIHFYNFYDGESEITNFAISTKNQKKASLPIKDEAYTSDDLFHNDVRVKHAYLDFPVNAFTYDVGIIKEYHDIKYFPSIYFNDDYPTYKRKIIIEVPEWLNIELKEMNFDGYNIQKTIHPGKDGTITYTYNFENVSGHFEENNAPGPSYLYPHILFLPKSFKNNGTETKIFQTTQDLYNWYKSLVNELKNDNSDIISKVRELTADAKNDEEKIKNIYYWIQDNIRYIAFEDGIAGFKPDEASNVFNKRYGDCKGMANLTKQMLLKAGFDARLTWVGTKHIAYDYSTPNLSVDNHMICTVYRDGKPLFLDGTEKFNSMGEFADRIQGKQVLIEDGEKYMLEFIPVHKAEFNAEKIKYNLELVDGNLQGEVNKKFQGESRASLLYYFNSLKNDKKEEFLDFYLSNGNSNINVSKIKTSDLNDRDLDLDVNYNIEVQNAVSEFGKDVYIDLDIDKELANYLMKKRETDFIFNYKKHLHSIFRLTIPEGYKVTHTPENISLKSRNYQLSVKFYMEEGGLVYEKEFRILNAKVETEDFAEWNGFINQLNNVYNEQIIITKG